VIGLLFYQSLVTKAEAYGGVGAWQGAIGGLKASCLDVTSFGRHLMFTLKKNYSHLAMTVHADAANLMLYSKYQIVKEDVAAAYVDDSRYTRAQLHQLEAACIRPAEPGDELLICVIIGIHEDMRNDA